MTPRFTGASALYATSLAGRVGQVVRLCTAAQRAQHALLGLQVFFWGVGMRKVILYRSASDQFGKVKQQDATKTMTLRG